MKKTIVLLFLCILLLCPTACSEGSSWTCPNDATENSGNFCAECGAPRPIINTWTCPNDATENSGNFCTECGSPRPVDNTWTCPACGTSGLTSAFCHECGSPRPAEKLETERQESPTLTCEGDGFDSADEAAIAYVNAFNTGDINSVLATFAVESYVDRMDAKATLDRIRSFNINLYSAIPVISPYTHGILIERRRNEIIQPLYYSWLLYTLHGTEYEDAGTGMAMTFQDDKTIEEFLSVLEANPMDNLVGHITVKAVYSPEDEAVAYYVQNSWNSEANQKNLEKLRAACGGDELAERVVFMDMDGTTAYQFMQCIRYGKKWYNLRTQSIFASMLGLSMFSNGLLIEGITL